MFLVSVVPLMVIMFSACSANNASREGAKLAGESADEAAGRVVQAVQQPVPISVSVPNDLHVDRQWSYHLMHRVIGSGGDKKILVAVLDTGIDAMHEDLVGNVVDEVNFSGSQMPIDVYGHGTHVAGIIAAHTGNGTGIAGLSRNARLLNVKVADDQGKVFPSDLAKGIVWAVDRGARVINISLCISNGNGTLEKAVDYAWSKGVLVVAAAGNCKSDQAPACYSHVISVGALDAQLDIWDKSNQGDCVNTYAPGVGIYSCRPGSSYGYVTGTSASAAMISAAAAEFLTTAVDENGDGFVNDEVFSRLKRTFSIGSNTD